MVSFFVDDVDSAFIMVGESFLFYLLSQKLPVGVICEQFLIIKWHDIQNVSNYMVVQYLVVIYRHNLLW